MRKAHQSILDPKYGGVRTSRKQLVDIENEFDDDDMQPNVSDSTHSSESEDDGAPGEVSDEEPDNHDNNESEPPGADEESDADNITEASNARDEQEDLSSTLKRNREQDRLKGLAVSQQLVGQIQLKEFCPSHDSQAIWDSLVDARIRLQKSLIAANRLPASLCIFMYRVAILQPHAGYQS